MEQVPVILLVEDDPNDALITQKALRKVGLDQKIIHVPDGWEAMLYLSGKPPFNDRSACPFPVPILWTSRCPNTAASTCSPGFTHGGN